jgi:hypothetical protein
MQSSVDGRAIYYTVTNRNGITAAAIDEAGGASMTVRSFITPLFYARKELANACLLTLAPTHLVLSVEILFRLKPEHVGMLFIGWLVLFLIAAYWVLITGLDPARNPLYYIVAFWMLPLLGFATAYGVLCVKSHGVSLEGKTTAGLFVERSDQQTGYLITPRSRWVGDRQNMGRSLSSNTRILVMGMVQFVTSVLVHTPHFAYVTFVVSWLYQIRRTKK